MIARILLLLFAVCSASWTGPFQLMESDGTVSVESVYRDPWSCVNHVVAFEKKTSKNWYFGVLDSGVTVSNFTFPETDHDINAVIRGPGDGLKLFLALSFRQGGYDHSVRFRESSDAGKTWSAPQVILEQGSDKRLQDMIYVKETGRLYVFFTNGQDLKMVSRPPGSIAFTAETLVAQGSYSEFNSAMAMYNLLEGKPLLHVAYKKYSNLMLMYTRSKTNGVTWEPAKDISGEAVECITNIVANEKITPTIYVAYSTILYGPAKMVYSSNHGDSFSHPFTITKDNDWHNNVAEGMALCGTDGVPLMSTLFVTKSHSVEYTMWDLASLKPTVKPHPYTMTGIQTAGLDCQVDVPRSLLNVTSFIGAEIDSRGYLFFATESDVFFGQLTAQCILSTWVEE